MEATGIIYKQISKIMAEVKSIGKDRVNEQQRFKFRGIDDVYNHVQPLFAKHGVFPAVQQREMMLRREGQTKSGGTMHFMTAMYDVFFFAEDGSNVQVTLEAEGMDSADKGTNKCHSVAHKYALLTLLMIPTEDFAEPDAVTPEPASFIPVPQPITPETLKRLNTIGSNFYDKNWDAKRPTLVSSITKGRTESSKDLTEDEAIRIIAGLEKKIEALEAEERQKNA
jgi:hypothetical protein